MTENEVLPVSCQVQSNEFWCWAAVASMVTGYYKSMGKPFFSQCQVAGTTLDVPDCCTPSPLPNPCLQLWDLADALERIGYNSQNNGTEDINVPATEIAAKRILAALMYYKNSGVLHYVLVNGCDDTTGKESVYVTDPAGPVGEVPWNTFLNNYGYHPNDPAIWKQWILIHL
jgi:hypothetical protein